MCACVPGAQVCAHLEREMGRFSLSGLRRGLVCGKGSDTSRSHSTLNSAVHPSCERTVSSE